MQDLYAENCKTLMKEISKGLNNWRNIPCLWTGTLNILKMSVFPKLICRYNAVPIKIPVRFVVYTDELTLKFMWTGKGSRIAKMILKILIKLEESHHLILRLTIQLQYSRQCGIRERIDIWTNATKERIQK